MPLDDEFLAVAVRNGLLEQVVADQLESLAASSGISSPQAALNAGRLSHDQIDVIESLWHPLDQVPGYELLSLLGQGGMGVVYKARQLAFDRIVALKLVRNGSASSTAVARFEQEIRTIGSFSHPHIVTAFDSGKHAGRLYLAMEYLDGQDAEVFIPKEKFLPERIVWGMIRQVATGLAYAAERGVTHRDIKPANLLLVTPPSGYPLPEGVPFVKVADFGLALLQEDFDAQTRLTRENATVGSPHYMSPEQIMGSQVGLKSDIYALGATAYHLLCGHPPYHGFTLTQIYSRKMLRDPAALTELRPGLSADSVSLVEWMIHREETGRPNDYATVLHRIDTIQQSTDPAGVSVSIPRRLAATPETSPDRYHHSPVAWSRRLMTISAIVVGLAAIAAGVWWFLLINPKLTGPRNWQATGWVRQCFDGASLNGWRTIRGAWVPGAKNEEGGFVLSGRGALGYPLAKPVNGGMMRLDGFRLSVLWQRQSARIVELQFPEEPSARRGETRSMVFQATPDSIRWGRRMLPTGSLETVFAERFITLSADSVHELRVEFQGGEWLVYLDGQLFGSSPAGPLPSSEFRLVAEVDPGDADGAAWFSDILLEELGPPI
ncbi:MAG: hypothetical protein C0478_00515 [Planctomyces sp.]|nr:hypothetical protein [Planctomyces sp.]